MLTNPEPGYIDTYYSRTLDSLNSAYPVLNGAEEADVCVIGGGLAGINTAFGLMQRGKKVVLLEQNRIGWGASGRNGGFVARGYAAGHDEIAARLGLDHARKLVDLTKDARNLIKSRITENNIDCGPLTQGVLTVSWSDKPDDMKKYVDDANRDFDAMLEYWPTERVREQCKTDKYYQGFLSPADYQFHSLRYIHALARILSSKGASIHENSGVKSVEKDLSGWCVKTDRGLVRARHVVLCCAIYSHGLDRRLENAAFPVQTYIMVTNPLDSETLKSSINTSYAIYDTRFASDYYRVLPDHRVMWGGRVGLWAAPHNIAAKLAKDMLKVYPQLEGRIKPELSWSGLLCYAPHKMPQIGMIEPGYWYCTGFGGHGLVPTTVGGEAIAEAIAGNRAKVDLFSPFGLGYAGGKTGRYVAQLVYWYWRACDYASLVSLKKAA